jgi:IS5 family transposase
MLRIDFLQNWFNLSDPAVEEVGRHLQANGMKVSTGTIVDATIINAPSSTKNREGKRDPAQIRVQKMHQTKKGNQWYFLNPTAGSAEPSLDGMKAHIGVDSETQLIHSVVVTSANVHDKHPIPQLLHGNEHRVYGDSAYASQKKLIRQAAPKAKDFTHQKASRHRPLSEREKNRTKSQVRAKVEHACLVIKRIFGFAKARYRGLKKNGNRLFVVATLTNLFLARRHLFRIQGARCAQ